MPNALDMHGEMVIERGKVYALVGQNRSGKSTLTNIICKLFPAKNGTILYNDIPYALVFPLVRSGSNYLYVPQWCSYESIARMALRDLISYVTQKPFIFPGTIRDNIMIGKPNATHAEGLVS